MTAVPIMTAQQIGRPHRDATAATYFQPGLEAVQESRVKEKVGRLVESEQDLHSKRNNIDLLYIQC